MNYSRTLFIALALVSLFAASSRADTTWVAPGNIEGVWIAQNSPYVLNGSVTIGSGDSLIIDSGVRIYIPGTSSITINGLLQTNGTVLDSVVFTTDTTTNPNGWRGLRFIGASDSCELNFTVIEHGRATGNGDLRYGGASDISNCDVRFNNCSIRHCVALIDAGAIYVRDAAAPMFTDCVFANNRTQIGLGGAVLCRSSSPTFENCDFYGNFSVVDGGALFFRNSAHGIVRGGSIHSNTAINGGGIGVLHTTTLLDISDCHMFSNTAVQNGGGIYSSLGVVNAERCRINGNVAGSGAGIYGSTTTLRMTNTVVYDHLVAGNGGGVYLSGVGTADFDFCTFAGNSATVGGAAYLSGLTSVDIASTNVAFNDGGAGIHIQSTPLVEIRFSNFFGNAGGEVTGITPPQFSVTDFTNYGGIPCDYHRNIFMDPMFINADSGNFNLDVASLCAQSAMGGTEIEEDVTGGQRPMPAQAQPDIGAYECEGGWDYLYGCGAMKGIIGPGNVIVDCDIWIEEDDTLEIVAGTTFSFAERYSFTVNGLLRAMGASNDSIYFTAMYPDSLRDWKGIRFINCHDSTKLNYVTIDRVRGETYSRPEGCGALYFSESSPRFFACDIRENKATFRGGCVACFDNSAPVFTDCVVGGNTVRNEIAADGGGVYSLHSAPEFYGCQINQNTAQRYGGGVFSDSSAMIISNCVIYADSAVYGGGLYCRGMGPRVTSTEIIENQALQRGGGIYCHSSANFDSCIIRSNLSFGDGGGIYSAWYASEFDRCVIAMNTAIHGGAMYAISSAPSLVRSTLYANLSSGGGTLEIVNAAPIINSSIISESQGYGVFFQGSSDAIIRHCDFYGNSEGNAGYSNADSTQGPAGIFVNDTVNIRGDLSDSYFNVSGNPLFVSPETGNYHLDPLSPCIQAGDPAIDTDPDGTIADIGAFFYYVNGSAPFNFDLLSPADGDTVDGSVDFCWQPSFDPDFGDPISYTMTFVIGETILDMPAGSNTCINVNLDSLPIPDSTEIIWWISAHSLIPDTSVRSTNTWNFVKAPIPSGVDNNPETVSEFMLIGNYPNPFNAATMILFDLPQPSDVKLSVFDISGRLVAIVLDEIMPSGRHRVEFSGGDVSSGVYFYKLEAGAFVAARKFVLVK